MINMEVALGHVNVSTGFIISQHLDLDGLQTARQKQNL